MEFDTKVDALSEEAPDVGEGTGAFGDLNDENVATITKQENGAEEVPYEFATGDGAGTGGGVAIGPGVGDDEDEDDDDDDDNINVTLGDVRKTGYVNNRVYAARWMHVGQSCRSSQILA
jgi:hypothetical protein